MIPSEWQIPIVVLTGLLGFGICLVLSEFSTRKNLVSISTTKKQAETSTTTKPGISLSSALSSSSNQGLRSNGPNNDTVTGAGGSQAASSLVTTTLVTDLISMTTDSPTRHLQPQHQQEPFDEDNDQGTSSLLSEPLKTPAKKRKSTNKLGLNSSGTGNSSELTGLIETPGGRRSARILRKVQQQQEKQE